MGRYIHVEDDVSVRWIRNNSFVERHLCFWETIDIVLYLRRSNRLWSTVLKIDATSSNRFCLIVIDVSLGPLQCWQLIRFRRHVIWITGVSRKLSIGAI